MATEPELTAKQVALLRYLGSVEGADLYNYGEAIDGRRLEARGLVVCVKAVNPPKNGAERQPYYGCAITDAGRDFISTANRIAMPA